eukprot:TRINITY_DN56586_c0_g1_i1.p1 TRINITY_DN56586_c0_g1~~TRINITY_DN56586_c0_g1_i1.p1  ORF type:complete len:641 (-),score=125.95 TRINITY_DN56586_c0_g1_i1:275-2197(-)
MSVARVMQSESDSEAEGDLKSLENGAGCALPVFSSANASSAISAFPSTSEISAEMPVDEEESHEAIWAAMETTVVRDCSTTHRSGSNQVQAGTPTSPPTAGVSGPCGVVLQDHPSSSSSSSSTSSDDAASFVDARSLQGEHDGGERVADHDLASTRAPSPLEDEEHLTMNDLFGDAVGANAGGGRDDDDMILPTLEEEQRRLADVVARREAVRAIAARYTPVLRPTNTIASQPEVGARPKEVLVLRSSHNDGLLGLGASADLSASSQASGARFMAVDTAASVDQIDESAFTCLDALSAADVDGASSTYKTPPSGVSSKYIASADAGDVHGEDEIHTTEGQENESAVVIEAPPSFAESNVSGVGEQAAVAETFSDGHKTQPVETSAASTTDDPLAFAPGPRRADPPWAPAPGSAMGPRVRPQASETSSLLNRLAAGLRGAGACPVASTGNCDATNASKPEGGTSGKGSTLAGDQASTKSISFATASAGRRAAEDAMSAAKLFPGSEVLLKGLSRQELNGKRAIVQPVNSKVQAGRVPVRLQETDSPQSLSIKIENVELVGLNAREEATALQAAKESAGGIAGASRPWPVSEECLRQGRLAEVSRQEDLWKNFLAGDDAPVGSDTLPPPEIYYSGGAIGKKT